MDECDSTSTFCSEVVTSKHFSELGTIFEQVEERLPKVVILYDRSIEVVLYDVLGFYLY